MKAVASFLIDLLYNAALFALVISVGVTALVGNMHTRGYRLSLYPVSTCVPAAQAEPHALSVNPFSPEAP